ncbi:MAG: folate-binding protein [Azoarcus sp.]|jgi:folate-binding protein YgfZ|nr:folate-binding protein [Azoarcus sp.]
MSSWNDYLARNGAKFDANAFQVDFGSPYANPNTLAGGCIAVPLLHLGLIQATGEEAGVFLHNLLSSDVAHLGADEAQWTSFNNAQGRMLANFLLWRGEDGYNLALAADLAPTLLKKLSMFVLRTKVKPAAAAPERALIGLAGPGANRVLKRASLAVPEADRRIAVTQGIRVIRLDPRLFVVDAGNDEAPAVFDALCGADATESGTSNWQLANIRSGLPLITAATQEAFVAQMVNYDLLGGVCFTKGCYPGQEVIARTQHIGKTKRRMFRIGFSSPAAGVAPGAPIFTPAFDLQSVGAIVNVAPLSNGCEALAVLRTECVAEAGEIHVGTPDGARAELLDLPYEVPL